MEIAARKIRVLVIDDSALVRSLLTRLLGEDPALQVVGAAENAYVARDMIKQLAPDVLTLDVEMPGMNGIQFLRNLMRLHPMPVVMCSTLTERGAAITLEALALGAVDFMAKPVSNLAEMLERYSEEFIGKVKAAASARVRPLRPAPVQGAGAARPHAAVPQGARGDKRLIAIGASTGGTEAVREVLARLSVTLPGIIISQHIPKAFSQAFARRLDETCALSVKQAEDRDPIEHGHAYVAPGDCHLLIERRGPRLYCRLSTAPPVNHHRPSVDVMFDSVAENVGAHALALMLTGMGSDGAKGMKALRDRGAHTVAQDEASSVVWGMPGSAVALGAVVSVLPLHDIAAELVGYCKCEPEHRQAVG